ncbi:MAG: hypothetical protein QOC63_3984 [Mycobacterium sp.]|jgi:hypothetical protein|nr:hypothetical protein [Mycobacterium sp.]
MATAEPFLGSAALAAGTLTRHTLRTRYRAIHHDVYIAKDADITAVLRAKACWLRSRGHGVLAGFSAAALHGARWIDANLPATIIDTNRRRTPGITVWADEISDDEICLIEGMRTTTPARTALDLARRYPVDPAVIAIDALTRATRLKVPAIEAQAQQHPGRRGLKGALMTLDLVDPGAESPPETRLRLLIVRAGFPRPQTQLRVYDQYGALIGEVDMGWRELKIAVEYEGDHHRTSRRVFHKDIKRVDALLEQGWIVIRVTSVDTEGGIIRQIEAAWTARGASW